MDANKREYGADWLKIFPCFLGTFQYMAFVAKASAGKIFPRGSHHRSIRGSLAGIRPRYPPEKKEIASRGMRSIHSTQNFRMAFNLKKVLKALLFSSSRPLAAKDIQDAFTRFHEQALL